MRGAKHGALELVGDKCFLLGRMRAEAFECARRFVGACPPVTDTLGKKRDGRASLGE